VAAAATSAGVAEAGTDAPADPADVDTGPGVDDSEIRVGLLNDFSGPIASIGTPSAIGAEVYFDYYNAEFGGVCERQVVAVRSDTKYDTQVAVQEYRAVKDDIAMITQLLGTGTVLALANDISRDGIVTLAGTLAANVIPLDHIYVYQTPFPIAAVNGVSYAAENLAADGNLQLGVIYQGDAYGEEGLAAVEHAVEELGNVDLVATASYSPTDEDFTSQVQTMKEAGAEVVWLHDTPRQTAAILGVSAQQGYTPQYISNYAGFASALVEPLGELLDNLLIVNSNASYGDPGEEMDTLVAAVEQYAPDQQADNSLVVGWLSGMVTVQALERACELGDLSREGISEAMVGLEVDHNGLSPNISFGETPEERIPSRESQIAEINLETTLPNAITEYFTSDAAETWTLPEG
jgi:ABC-type branched-subunit amino acid transport system substrate-binding protein